MLSRFPEIVVLDAEFHTAQIRGNRPIPVCICAVELRSGRQHRLWCDGAVSRPNPLPAGALYVAFSASAEWLCYHALGWECPHQVIDLHAEFRCQTNGLSLDVGRSLLGAAAYYGCPALPAAAKQEMRELILTGGPFDADQRKAILDYCMSDVELTAELLRQMVPEINVGAALERGRYSKAVAAMEWHGIPTDVELLRALQENWSALRQHLVTEVEGEHHYGVYTCDADDVCFSHSAFEELLVREGLDEIWKRTKHHRPKLEKEYFKQMAQMFPQIEPLRALRKTILGLRELNPPVGSDGRNRSSVRPYEAKTSRNQPRTSEMIMCFPAWTRSLMRAEPGRALLYVDLSSAEFGIAAALSRDPGMMEDYRAGDPYLALGKRTGMLSPCATRNSHPKEREILKTVCLGVQYGMGARTLGVRLAMSDTEAKDLLRLHRRAYPQYWQYANAVLETAQFEHSIWTTLDWRLNDAHRQSANTIRNFPMQATCGDILRLASSLTTEAGLEVVAPFHDALLLHVPLGEVDAVLEFVKRAWARSSAVLLGGFELASETRREKAVFAYPGRYVDGREADLYEKAVRFVEYKRRSNPS
jgi:DNA polymerase I